MQLINIFLNYKDTNQIVNLDMKLYIIITYVITENDYHFI